MKEEIRIIDDQLSDFIGEFQQDARGVFISVEQSD